MSDPKDTLLDLQAYCSTDPRRAKQLGVPWSDGSYSYACDGRMLLRVPRRSEIAERDTAPGVAHLVAGTSGEEHFPLPLQPLPAACAECDGTGLVPMVVPVGFGPQYISNLYLARLHALPGARLANHPSDKNGPLHFHFDGGDGVVMPIKKD